jgi:hypothetical protein
MPQENASWISRLKSRLVEERDCEVPLTAEPMIGCVYEDRNCPFYAKGFCDSEKYLYMKAKYVK